jgi:membrane protease YdiL (CAAX protease family)
LNPASLILTSTAQAATTAPTAVPSGTGEGVGALAIMLVGAAAALAIAWFAGLLRAARLGTERRIPPGRPMMPLAGAMFAALVVWVVMPALFLKPAPVEPGRAVPATQPGVVEVPGRLLVIVNATVPALAFIVLLAGDGLVRRRVGQRLGFRAGRLPHGIVAGLGAMALTLPLVLATMSLTTLIYRWVGYQHPEAHDLLRIMSESGALVKNLAILAAVLVAPLWEELLFRGHVQTLIFEGLVRVRQGPPPYLPDAPARPGETLEYYVGPARAEAAETFDATPRPLEAWLAVLLASALFAGVHQPWMWPPIFVLSLCIGLAYERTRNLWVPVVMHATFNGLMTAYFLLQLP